MFIRRITRPLADKRIYTIVNLPQMNEILYTCARNGVDKYTVKDSRDELKKTEAELAQEWTPHGVIQGEIGGPTQDQPQERLVNLIIAGRSPVFNVWGKDGIKDGTPLWFVLYRTNMSDDKRRRFRTTLDDGAHVSAPAPKDDGRVRCYQWMPYAHHEKHHPSEGWDKTNGDIVKCVYVGRVSSKGYLSTHASENHTDAALTSVDKLVTLPQIEMFVDYANTL